MRRSSNTSTEWWEQQTAALKRGRPPRVEVCLRSLAPPIGARSEQERILERLASLENRGLFESVSVTVWGKAICPDSFSGETVTGRRILDRVDAFRSWADGVEVPVRLPFEHRPVSSTVTAEEYRKITLPRLCLAVYAGDSLALVLPGQLDDVSVCVDEFLSLFERQSPTEREIGTSA